MVDAVVTVTLLAVVAGLSLIFRRGVGPQPARRNRVGSVAKYVIAMFLGTYGAIAAATLLVLPILLYGILAHSQAAKETFSAAVDRPYFPLQSVVAFAIGFAVAVWLRQGKPMWVWIWPITQLLISVTLLKPESVMQGFATNVWHRYFDWGCGCSATLLQWQVMSAVYASLAFTLGVLARYGLAEREPDSRSSQIKVVSQ